jgi:hypothetical protein
VHAGWYWRYLDALDPQSEVGMVLEAGPVSACARHVYATLTGAEPGADLASSPCLVVDAAAARQLGTFDPRLAPFWQDADYAMRARRLGYHQVSVSSGDRLIPGSTVEEPLLDAETQAYLAERWQRLRDGLADARQVLVVALAEEVRHEPSLLSAYAQAFSAADDVTLAIYAPDADAASLERDLVPSVERAGLAAEDGADVLLLPLPRDRSEDGLAHAAHAVLSNVPATGALATLPRFDAGQVDAIRSLVHRCRRRAA